MSQSALAVFGDIHSNLEALEAVLADIASLGVRRRVCLGDIVGYAANPAECLELVRALGCPVLMGNHDAFAANDEDLEEMRDVARAGIEFTRQKLTAKERQYLAGLPLVITDHDCEFVHASLNRPEDWTYVVRPQALQEHFRVQKKHIAFGAHTHVPCIWHFSSIGELSPLGGRGQIDLPRDGKILVNVGSVGQPRDLCRDACYAIFYPKDHRVEFRRIPYRTAKTKRKIALAKLPRFSAQRLSLGR